MNVIGSILGKSAGCLLEKHLQNLVYILCDHTEEMLDLRLSVDGDT